MAEILDPLGSKSFFSRLKKVRALALKREDKEMMKLVDETLEAFVNLSLLPSSDTPQVKFGCFLLSHGQGIVRGEGLKRDEQGVLVMGDASMELGDLCYAHGEERLPEGEQDASTEGGGQRSSSSRS